MGTMRWSKYVVNLAVFAGSVVIATSGAEAQASAALGGAAGGMTKSSQCTQPLPDEIAAPAGTHLELELRAVGVQIYTCTATPGGAAWVFTAPDANLYDRRGTVAGTHYAGPTWKSNDGSTVVAAKVSGVTVDPAAIPWLLLGAVSHDRGGEMHRMTHVQRVSTAGGMTPTTGCSAATVGATTRVPYTATYCFYDKE